MGAADARLALTTVATRGPAPPAAAALQEHSASQMGASKVALVSAAVALAVLQQPAASKLIAPSWDYAFPTQKQTCVNATASTPADKGTNERWVFHAVPEGTPPASGWPVWLSLVTDTFGSLDGHSECGGGGRPGFRRRTQHHHGSSGKSFKAFDTPNATMTFASRPRQARRPRRRRGATSPTATTTRKPARSGTSASSSISSPTASLSSASTRSPRTAGTPVRGGGIAASTSPSSPRSSR